MRDKNRKLTIVGAIASVVLVVGFVGWYVYGSVGAFPFFFVSMFVIIFLQMKREAAKIGKSPIDLIINRERLPKRRKLVFCLVAILGTALALSLLIPLGFETYPWVVMFGFISFAIVMAVVMLMAFVYGLGLQWHFARHHFELWKKSMFSSSMATRYQAGRQLASLSGPVAKKWGILVTKVAKIVLLLWLIILVIVATVVVVADQVGK